MRTYNAQKYQRIIFTRGLTMTSHWCWCSPNVKCKYLVVSSATHGLRDTGMRVCTSREASKSRDLCCSDVQLDIYTVINVRCQQSSLVDCRTVEWLSTRSLVKYTTTSFVSSRLALFKLVRALDQKLPLFKRRVPSWWVSRLSWASCQSSLPQLTSSATVQSGLAWRGVSHARSRCLMRTTPELMAASTVRWGSKRRAVLEDLRCRYGAVARLEQCWT